MYKLITYDTVWHRINEIIEPFRSYKESQEKLSKHPPGYGFVFALNYVDADIRNGGIPQLYQNTTWPLIFDAAEGARAFGWSELTQALIEIIYYYHRSGRSRLKRRIPPGYFDNLKEDWNKSLQQLEDQFYAAYGRTSDAKWYRSLSEVLPPLVTQHNELFAET